MMMFFMFSLAAIFSEHFHFSTFFMALMKHVTRVHITSCEKDFAREFQGDETRHHLQLQ